MDSAWDNMVFQDKTGKILLPEEVDEMSIWEIKESGIRVFRDKTGKKVYSVDEISAWEIESLGIRIYNIH